MKKIIATAFAGMFALTAAVGLNVPTTAEAAESYDVTIGFGGDKEEGDWKYAWNGDSGEEGVTFTGAKIAAGETVKVSLEFATPCINTWYVAPAITGIENLDPATTEFVVKCYVDGKEVAINKDADADEDERFFWHENVGDNYKKENTYRLYGGMNEWAASRSYIERPVNFSKIEYEITAVKINGDEGTPAAKDDASTEAPKTDEAPSTGDAAPVAMVAAVMVAAAAGVVVMKKREN